MTNPGAASLTLMKAAKCWWRLLLCILLSSCANVPTLAQRQQNAKELAAARGWQGQLIKAGDFVLQSYLPATQLTQELTVYLEGDGLAWLNLSTPSTDPTPRDPLALRLALAHTQGLAVYLARPCQFTGPLVGNCAPRYWQEARFASEVVNATLQALDHLKATYQAQRLRLVGYSGGAAIAALAATRRNDVTQLITVAGNLDLEAWTKHHRITTLTDSLDPAKEQAALSRVPQRHYAGGRDAVIPPFLLQGFLQSLQTGVDVQLVVEPTYNHRCCWVENWPKLLHEAVIP